MKATAQEQLHYALALLSAHEFGDPHGARANTCPTCGWPRGGHHGTRHEPGCSLERVLRGEVPERLESLEERYGDAAYGHDGLDRKRYATPIVERTE